MWTDQCQRCGNTTRWGDLHSHRLERLCKGCYIDARNAERREVRSAKRRAEAAAPGEDDTSEEGGEEAG